MESDKAKKDKKQKSMKDMKAQQEISKTKQFQ